MTQNLRIWFAFACLLVLTTAGSAWWIKNVNTQQESLAVLKLHTPTKSTDGGYISSDACRSCHPGEFASWHGSYHRTMTQLASPKSVLGNFDNVELNYFGKKFLLERRGDEFWVNQVGGSSARVVQTTGSHHYQVYWVHRGNGNLLQNFPFVFLLREKRWVRRNDVFMMPPEIGNEPESVRLWNDSCISCHATHGQPRANPEAGHAATQVAELGIACESCHGPAKDHAEFYRNPAERYRVHLGAEPPRLALNPASCSSKESSQVCGQCHGITRERNRNGWNERGFEFRPGDSSLEETRIVARHPRRVQQDWQKQVAPDFFEKYYWNDGMVRVSGREFNGLVESPCYQQGELSCLSCHSMHDSDPNDQLRRDTPGNHACLQCHTDIGRDIAEHTHHDPGSDGSLCYNCHMPRTTYGLLKAIRSHEIDSPDVLTSIQSGRPNACNLCHIDKTLAWTAQSLSTWYGHDIPTMTTEQMTVSATIQQLLSGDAGQRALAAWHLGWEPAIEASNGDVWIPPFLAQLLVDPYAAVRYVAERSLRSRPGFANVDYDFTVLPPNNMDVVDKVISQWRSVRPNTTSNREILIDDEGKLMMDELKQLLRLRNNRPVDLLE